MATASERRCSATNKRGERCRATVIGSDGFCHVHGAGVDMKALGRAGGKARHKPNPERVHEGLREYLKREVSPAEVWAALKLAMEGQNESARVSASRVLMDALAEPHEERDRYAEFRAEMEVAAAKFDEWLPRAMATVIARLLTTGKAHPSDAGVVHQTIDLIEQGDPRQASNPLVSEWTWQKMGPLFERLRAERSVEEEIERRVAERTVDLERGYAELKAQRAELSVS